MRHTLFSLANISPRETGEVSTDDDIEDLDDDDEENFSFADDRVVLQRAANCSITTDDYGYIITTCFTESNGTSIISVDNDTSTSAPNNNLLDALVPRLTAQNFTSPRSNLFSETEFLNGKFLITALGLCVTSQLAYIQLRRQLAARPYGQPANYQLFSMCLAFGYFIYGVGVVGQDIFLWSWSRSDTNTNLDAVIKSWFLLSRFFLSSVTSYFLVWVTLDKLLYAKYAQRYRDVYITRARALVFILVAIVLAALAVLPLVLMRYFTKIGQWFDLACLGAWFCLQDLFPIAVCFAANAHLACLTMWRDRRAKRRRLSTVDGGGKNVRRMSSLPPVVIVRHSTWITLMLLNASTLVFSVTWPVSNLITILCHVLDIQEATAELAAAEVLLAANVSNSSAAAAAAAALVEIVVAVDTTEVKFCDRPSLFAYQDSAQMLYSLRPLISALIFMVLMPQSRVDWQRYILKPLTTCGGANDKKKRRKIMQSRQRWLNAVRKINNKKVKPWNNTVPVTRVN